MIVAQGTVCAGFKSCAKRLFALHGAEHFNQLVGDLFGSALCIDAGVSLVAAVVISLLAGQIAGVAGDNKHRFIGSAGTDMLAPADFVPNLGQRTVTGPVFE